MRIKLFIIIPIVCISIVSCTNNKFIDTGISKGRFDGSLLEYMEAPYHSYDWDSTARMVRHAGAEVVRLFEGKDPNYPEITFFGPTNHSIRRYMLEKKIEKIEDMDPDWCRNILLRHVFEGKIYREDVPEGRTGTSSNIRGEGGEEYEGITGNKIWLYTFTEPYEGIEKAGPTYMYFINLDYKNILNIASTNIEPDNCVVHSFGYDFTLGEL